MNSRGDLGDEQTDCGHRSDGDDHDAEPERRQDLGELCSRTSSDQGPDGEAERDQPKDAAVENEDRGREATDDNGQHRTQSIDANQRFGESKSKDCQEHDSEARAKLAAVDGNSEGPDLDECFSSWVIVVE